MFLQQGDLAVAFIPRCGTRTFWHLLPNARKIDNVQVTASVRLAFIRRPFDRHEAAFNRLRVEPNYPDQYEQYVDWMLEEAHDSHVVPQYDLITVDDKLVPNKIHLLEHLDNVWYEYAEGVPEHRNSYPRIEIDESYRRAEIDARYQKDEELYQKVLEHVGRYR